MDIGPFCRRVAFGERSFPSRKTTLHRGIFGNSHVWGGPRRVARPESLRRAWRFGQRSASVASSAGAQALGGCFGRPSVAAVWLGRKPATTTGGFGEPRLHLGKPVREMLVSWYLGIYPEFLEDFEDSKEIFPWSMKS